MLTNPPEHVDARANPESAWEFEQHLRKRNVFMYLYMSQPMEINGIKSRCAQPRMTHISIIIHVMEILKSNFRQYRPMEKQRWEESERRAKERRSDKRKNEKKKMQVREKVGKLRNTAFLQ